jgi:hypothetical protein
MDHQNRAICGAKNVAHNKYTSMQRKILGMCLSYLHAALVGADEEADRGAPWQQVGGVPWPPPEPERSSGGRGMHRVEWPGRAKTATASRPCTYTEEETEQISRETSCGDA